MPYQPGYNLPGERASKLGHLKVLQSPLVQKLVSSFDEDNTKLVMPNTFWKPWPDFGDPLDIIFAVDGSLQTLEDSYSPRKAISFVKTALLRLDQKGIKKIDPDFPHPFAVRDLLEDSALHHATVFPLRHIQFKNLSIYDAVRKIIFESMKDASLEGQPMETLKWLAYEKWLPNSNKSLPGFKCPHCVSEEATLPFDSEEGYCTYCGNSLYITDMLGFHLEMAEDSASETIATAYMSIHETMLLFTGIRHFWETNKETLKRCLFIKDGPLQIRAQYSKLVNPIRRFLLHATNEGIPVCIFGQEKTGYFVDHLNLIERQAPSNHYFIPDHQYICQEIQHRPVGGAPYGKDTNYGAKVFLTIGDRYRFVCSIPISQRMDDYIKNPKTDELIGFNRILATLPLILSSKHENALIPIELANSIASLSTYPSAQILKIFTENAITKK